MNLTVKNIIEDKQYFDEVLNLLYKEWGNNNFEFWKTWVQSSMSSNSVPMTFIVFCDKELVGTFSLWRCDLDLQSRQDLFPWLAGIVVKEERRGKGIGLFIQNQAKKILKNLGFDKAYLSTEMTGYYERTGWQYIGKVHDRNNYMWNLYEITL